MEKPWILKNNIMKTNIKTSYGNVLILNLEFIFEQIIQAIEALCHKSDKKITVGLTGGSTPKAFYQWAAQNRVIKNDILDQIIWMTSDERYVPWDSEESNFGNADRLLLEPIGVLEENKRPWSIGRSPQAAAKEYENFFKTGSSFDLCILGMGDDCHTASLFPGSALIGDPLVTDFAALSVPGKGTRLTITPKGLSRCDQIFMVVTGYNKAVPLKHVLEGPLNENVKPAQIHAVWPQKVTWLIDHAASCQLNLS